MTKKEEFIKLGWDLIKYKIYYYEFFNPQISDYKFDQMEARYRKLAEELNLPPSASDMVEVDYSRPSVQIVLHKIRGGNNQNIEYIQEKENRNERKSKKVKKRTKQSNRKKS